MGEGEVASCVGVCVCGREAQGTRRMVPSDAPQGIFQHNPTTRSVCLFGRPCKTLSILTFAISKESEEVSQILMSVS